SVPLSVVNRNVVAGSEVVPKIVDQLQFFRRTLIECGVRVHFTNPPGCLSNRPAALQPEELYLPAIALAGGASRCDSTPGMRRNIPQADGTVAAGGGDGLAVRREGDAADAVGVALQVGQQLACLRVPQLHLAPSARIEANRPRAAHQESS